MTFPLVFNLVGTILMFSAGFMALPAIVALLYGSDDLFPLMASALITAVSGWAMFAPTKKYRRLSLKHKDAFLMVTFCWTAVALFGAMPFYLSGAVPSLTDAVFESMSGFTTTGASILTDVEALPKGVLFWRSLTHWMGGMGIVVLFLAVMPVLGAGGMQLFRAEASEVVVEKLRPRIIDTAKSLWLIYVAFTALGVVLLLVGGMNVFDALCHTFGALATGGFSTKNTSIAYYGSSYIHYVIIFLMFLGGINFSLHFYAFRGNPAKYFKNSEFLFYASVLGISTVIIAISVFGSYASSSAAFRDSLFQAVSITTTTGYITADYEKWPVFTQTLLLCLMFFGGMVSSTGGGMKQARVMIALKQIYRELYQLIHPHAVTYVKLGGRELSKEVLGGVWGFMFLFLALCVVSTLLMTAFGLDIVTASTSVVSAMCNIGPALGEAGPTDNYSGIPAAGKWVLTFCMLAGRLEVFTVMVLFMPHFWKK